MTNPIEKPIDVPILRTAEDIRRFMQPPSILGIKLSGGSSYNWAGVTSPGSSRSVSSFHEACEAYKKAPSGSEEESEALEDWRRSCSTPSEYYEVWRKTANGSEAEARVLRDWLSSCSTADEADKVYRKAPANSEIEAEARSKRDRLRGD